MSAAAIAESAQSAEFAGLAELAELAELAQRVRPVTLVGQHCLPLAAGLAELGPIRQGTIVEVVGPSLVLRLLAGPTAAGSWTALVGAPELNLAAAPEHGVALERVAVITAPPSDLAGSVVAALVDALTLVALGPAVVQSLRGPVARRLSARARERGCVVLSMGAWPEPADRRLSVTDLAWEGLGHGWGHLRAGTMVVHSEGRGAAARPASYRLAG